MKADIARLRAQIDAVDARLVKLLNEVSGIEPKVQHGPPRPGDVRHSLADITAARDAFGFEPCVSLEEGLKEYMDWVKKEAVRP